MAGGQRWMLMPDDVLIIPPHVPHGFRYCPNSRWVSVKLAVEGRVANEARLAALSAMRDALCMALRSLLPPVGTAQPQQREVLSGVLAAMVASVFQETAAGRTDRTGLVADVRRHVERFGGKPASVVEVAAQLGYSIGHALAVFRRHAGMNLKTFLDRERVRCAAEALRYSDLRVGAIAGELGFLDLFAFSRFFKRTMGQSPRQYRKVQAQRVPRKNGPAALYGGQGPGCSELGGMVS